MYELIEFTSRINGACIKVHFYLGFNLFIAGYFPKQEPMMTWSLQRRRKIM